MANETFIVLLWGIAGSEVQGPFAELHDAESWLTDNSFEDDENFEAGMVVGPLPTHLSRVV